MVSLKVGRGSGYLQMEGRDMCSAPTDHFAFRLALRLTTDSKYITLNVSHPKLAGMKGSKIGCFVMLFPVP